MRQRKSIQCQGEQAQRHRAGGTKLSSAAERPSKAGTQSVQWSDSGKASARRVGPRLCGFCKKEGTSGTAGSSLEAWWRRGKVRWQKKAEDEKDCNIFISWIITNQQDRDGTSVTGRGWQMGGSPERLALMDGQVLFPLLGTVSGTQPVTDKYWMNEWWTSKQMDRQRWREWFWERLSWSGKKAEWVQI